MVEYKNVTKVSCRKENDKWTCDITRLLSEEPKEIDDRLCYIQKTETEPNLETVSLREKAKICTIQSIGEKANFLECK